MCFPSTEHFLLETMKLTLKDSNSMMGLFSTALFSASVSNLVLRVCKSPETLSSFISACVLFLLIHPVKK